MTADQSAEKDAPTRSRWAPGHLDGCKQFPTGWLCEVACPVPASECVFPPLQAAQTREGRADG